jgi:shikimate dehydrogenase
MNSGKTKKYAVVGNPVSHSLSPKIFGTLFDYFGLDCEYEKIKAKEGDLPKIIKSVKTGKVSGLSITVPYKEKIIPFLDNITDSAKKIGAVNTVYKKGNKVIGDNTDWLGFKYSLLGKVFTGDPDLPYKRVLVYGAGGVSRSCVYALKEIFKSENIFVINRTPEKGVEIAQQFGVNFVEEGRLPNVDILINATSAGLNGEELNLPTAFLNKLELIFDVVYGETLLSKKAAESNVEYTEGSDMLLRQAVLQFNLFTNLNADIDVVRGCLEK